MEKVVIITGAAGNLGLAVTRKFLSENYRVVATIEPNRQKDADALQELSGSGISGTLEVHRIGLTNEVAVENFVTAIIDRHDHIDAAVMLVGGYAAGGIKETDGDAMAKMLDLNFKSAYLVARPAFKQMMAQAGGGRLVLIGARPAFDVQAGRNAIGYALSKSLLFKLAELLNAEGKEKNVVTSIVVPSTIDTPANRAAMPEADFSSWVKPSDIAEVIYFACSEAGIALRETVLKVYGNA